MKNASMRRVAVETALAKIEEICDRKVASFGSDLESDYKLLPTGISSLDTLLGLTKPSVVRGKTLKYATTPVAGGIVKGGITEIYGPESTGKTTLALQMIAAAQQRDELCCFVDLGRSFSKVEATKLGVDVDDLIVAAPMSIEEALKVIQTLLESDAIGLCVIDALGALQPHTVGNTMRGIPKSKASLITQVIKNVDLLAAQSGTTCVITRRMNPTYSRPAAGDSAIHKAAKTTLELIRPTKDVPSYTLRLHKHVPANFYAGDGIDPKVMSI